MNPIIQLPKEISDKIAAGEVVSGPVSVVKELVENSVDASSKQIVVEINDGGKSFVRVTDDGCGIPLNQVDLALSAHATSKLHSEADLDNINTLGFRGEALASIAAVSKIEITTKTSDEKAAAFVFAMGGEIMEKKSVGAADGTTVIVRDLFFNTPARLKFLKSVRSETGKIIEYVSKMAIAHPDIRFRMISNGHILFSTAGRGDARAAILTVYGDLGEDLLPIECDNGESAEDGSIPFMRLAAWVSGPNKSRSTRRNQAFFVNGRAISDEHISKAISDAYREFMFEGRFPVVFLFLGVDPSSVDVNVHPSKNEVRFRSPDDVSGFISGAIRGALSSKAGAPSALPAKEKIRLTRESRAFFKLKGDEDGSGSGPTGPRDEALKSSGKGGRRRDGAEDEGYYPEEININELWSTTGAAVEPAGMARGGSMGQQSFVSEPDEAPGYGPKVSGGEAAVQTEMDIDSLSVLGTVFAAYIVATDADCFYFIDQHAAHERINYENFLEQRNNAEKLSQQLLTPDVIQVPAAVAARGTEWTGFLNSVGYDADIFGESSVIIKAVPAFLDPGSASAFLNDVLSGESKPPSQAIDIERLISRACKQAVKANRILKDEEIRGLLADLSRCENPFSCPHGRPVFLKLSKSDVERLFKRA